jgi:hypothetical protein
LIRPTCSPQITSFGWQFRIRASTVPPPRCSVSRNTGPEFEAAVVGLAAQSASALDMGEIVEVNFSDMAEHAWFGRHALFRLLEMLRYQGKLQRKLCYCVTRSASCVSVKEPEASDGLVLDPFNSG